MEPSVALLMSMSMIRMCAICRAWKQTLVLQILSFFYLPWPAGAKTIGKNYALRQHFRYHRKYTFSRAEKFQPSSGRADFCKAGGFQPFRQHQRSHRQIDD